MIRQLPNLVSLLRLGLAPLILRAIWNREYETALVWLLFAAFSDILDGFLARQLKVTSRTGAYLDPIADKVLLSGAYVVLGYDRVIPVWLTMVVLGRDALMLLFISYAYFVRRIREFPPTVWGKLSTFLQIFAALIVLLTGIWYLGTYEYEFRTGLLYAAGGATVWSAVDYARIGRRMLAEAKVRESAH